MLSLKINFFSPLCKADKLLFGVQQQSLTHSLTHSTNHKLLVYRIYWKIYSLSEGDVRKFNTYFVLVVVYFILYV